MSRDSEDIPSTETSTEKSEDLVPPPDGGYGWVCVGACFIINAFSWGLTTVSGPSIVRPKILTKTSSLTAFTFPFTSTMILSRGRNRWTLLLLAALLSELPC